MIELHAEGVLLHIRVKTRARAQSFSITEDPPVCLVCVKAAPARGRANREVIKLVAKRLKISTSQIKLVAGVRSPRKTLLIESLAPEDVRAAFQH